MHAPGPALSIESAEQEVRKACELLRRDRNNATAAALELILCECRRMQQELSAQSLCVLVDDHGCGLPCSVSVCEYVDRLRLAARAPSRRLTQEIPASTWQPAAGLPHHVYRGSCPDEFLPDAFDPDCPACRALQGAALVSTTARP